MALNQIERAMLVAAREYLVDKRYSRVCYAITAAENFMADTMAHCRREAIRKASGRLRTFIMEAIEQQFGFEDWAYAKGHLALSRSAVSLRTARIAWLDWLLDEPWTDHSGGPCPLLPGEKAIARLRNGTLKGEDGMRAADTYRWDHWQGSKAPILCDGGPYDIVAYKVIYEAPTC